MRKLTTIAVFAVTVVAMSGVAAAKEESNVIRFGVQDWPGVTVKTEVAASLLQALGYETEQETLGTPLIVHGLSGDKLDVALGAWYPVSAVTVDPAVELNTITKLTANVTGALSGVAVPTYVYEEGVTSVADLQSHGKRFNRKIYGIEAGADWNLEFKRLIKSDKYGLGKWELVPSSSSGVLEKVGDAIENNEWIAFYGWKPHLMNVEFDISYLDSPDDEQIAKRESKVYTLVPHGFSENRPNVARFFTQYQIPVEVQSQWVYEYGHENKPAGEIAEEWIQANGDLVRQWLKGVNDANGEPAYPKVQSEYGLD